MIKLSDYIFEFLEEKGIRHAFMLPGGGAMHLDDSLGKSGMEYVCFLHEQGAAIAAEAYGQYTNTPGLLLVTSGPGATNAITGVTAGWIDSTPMFVISGQSKRSDLVGDKQVRQIGSQEVQIIPMVTPITKYAVQILEPEEIRYHLERAYYEATSGRKGPVWLDIPLDVQASMINVNMLRSFYKETSFDNEKKDITCEVESIIKKIYSARKPLILAGNGIISAGCEDAFYRMIEHLNIPVQTTWKAIDLMWEEHPLYAGHPGTLGERGANFIIQECDLLISLGARLDSSITAFNEENFAPKAEKIVIDIDEAELNKFTMKINMTVCCDVGFFLRTLNEKLDKNQEENQRGARFEQWTDYCNAVRAKYPVILPDYAKKEKFVDGYYFTGVLSDMLEENEIIVPESAGVTTEATIQAFKSKRGQHMKHAAGLGSMGFALPYSIGACLAYGKRRTIAIDGDGAFQLNIQELETLHRLQLPIKFFIWNNQGYASIRGMQRNNFKGHYVASDEASGLTIPNISKVAEAYGLQTFRIFNNSEVASTIQKVLETDEPVICEVMVDPDEIVMPKVQSRVGENGQMIPGRLEDMWPYLDEETIDGCSSRTGY